MESAKAFIEKMNTDEDFRKKVTECKDNEARKAFVLKEGYDFTADDLKLEELSDSELGELAAGIKVVPKIDPTEGCACFFDLVCLFDW
jgi:predicted ribosomally synthesized peptide with nif11-like leader